MATANGTARLTGLDLMVRRREAGLTQEQVARALSVSRRRVSAIERQYRPSASAVSRYLAALDVAVEAVG